MFKPKKLTRNQVLVYSGVLSALAFIVNLVELPFFMAPWLKIELSEVIVLLAASINILVAINVSILKALLTFITTGGGNVIGYAVLTISSLLLVLTYYNVKKVTSKINALLITSIIFTVVMVVANYFYITPLYMGMSFAELSANGIEGQSYFMYIVTIYVAFNILKMALVSACFYALSNALEKVK